MTRAPNAAAAGIPREHSAAATFGSCVAAPLEPGPAAP